MASVPSSCLVPESLTSTPSRTTLSPTCASAERPKCRPCSPSLRTTPSPSVRALKHSLFCCFASRLGNFSFPFVELSQRSMLFQLWKLLCLTRSFFADHLSLTFFFLSVYAFFLHLFQTPLSWVRWRRTVLCWRLSTRVSLRPPTLTKRPRRLAICFVLFYILLRYFWFCGGS